MNTGDIISLAYLAITAFSFFPLAYYAIKHEREEITIGDGPFEMATMGIAAVIMAGAAAFFWPLLLVGGIMYFIMAGPDLKKDKKIRELKQRLESAERGFELAKSLDLPHTARAEELIIIDSKRQLDLLDPNWARRS